MMGGRSMAARGHGGSTVGFVHPGALVGGKKMMRIEAVEMAATSSLRRFGDRSPEATRR
jgi:hypothetical protein